jgi:hypothetical protein
MISANPKYAARVILAPRQIGTDGMKPIMNILLPMIDDVSLATAQSIWSLQQRPASEDTPHVYQDLTKASSTRANEATMDSIHANRNAISQLAPSVVEQESDESSSSEDDDEGDEWSYEDASDDSDDSDDDDDRKILFNSSNQLRR